MNVEGIPDGWELVAIRQPKENEFHLDSLGNVVCCGIENNSCTYPIIRKIKKPKQYRPFANAREFAPFLDKWWRYKDDISGTHRRTNYIDDKTHHSDLWTLRFNRCEFVDGTPFGIEVNNEQ